MDTSELFFLIKCHINNQLTTDITKHSCHHIDRDDRNNIWGLARQVSPFSTKNNSPSFEFIIRCFHSLFLRFVLFSSVSFILVFRGGGFRFYSVFLFFSFFFFCFLVKFKTLNMFESLKTSVSWYP